MNGYCIDQLINDQAGLFRPDRIVVPQCTDWVNELQVGEEGSLVVLLLVERARSEGARSTRAIEDRPGHPLKGSRGRRRGEGAVRVPFLLAEPPR